MNLWKEIVRCLHVITPIYPSLPYFLKKNLYEMVLYFIYKAVMFHELDLFLQKSLLNYKSPVNSDNKKEE